jgi:acetylornithine deacetylase/succinyl-diaminopimelate desuccinylase-like protein
MHASNENIRISDYLDAIRLTGRLVHRLAEQALAGDSFPGTG